MGTSEAIVSDVKDTIRNTFAIMTNALSVSERAKIDTVELRDVEIVASGGRSGHRAKRVRRFGKHQNCG